MVVEFRLHRCENDCSSGSLTSDFSDKAVAWRAVYQGDGYMERATHRIRFLKPAAGLKDVVRFYVQREAQLRGHDLVHPVPARAAPMLEFIFSEPFEIHWCERPLVETTPRPVLIGLQTHRRVRLVMRGMPYTRGLAPSEAVFRNCRSLRSLKLSPIISINQSFRTTPS